MKYLKVLYIQVLIGITLGSFMRLAFSLLCSYGQTDQRYIYQYDPHDHRPGDFLQYRNRNRRSGKHEKSGQGGRQGPGLFRNCFFHSRW